MATVRIGSVPALHLGGLPGRLRAFVVANSRAITFGCVPLVLISLGLLLLTPRAGIGEESAIDYQVYRWAVHTWLAGGDIMNTAPMVSIGRVLPWVYPPFALAPLAPLALLPFSAGLIALYLLDLLAIGGTLYLVTRRLWPVVGPRGALAVAMTLLPLTLFLEPVYSSFGLGQVNILLMGLVMADCLAESPRWPRGMLIGLAAAIKLTPAAFLLFLVVRKNYRAAVVAVATAIVATLAGFVLNYSAAVEYWLGKGPAHGVSGSAFHTNQSIMGALSRFELTATAQNGLWLVLSVGVTMAVVFAIRRVEPVLAVSANALLALLISPTSWSDHWVWCAPGLLVLLGYAVRRRSLGWLALAVWTLVTVLAAAFNWMPSGPPWDVVAHLFGNPYAVLGLAMIALLVRHARHYRVGSVPQPSPLPEPAGV